MEKRKKRRLESFTELLSHIVANGPPRWTCETRDEKDEKEKEEKVERGNRRR